MNKLNILLIAAAAASLCTSCFRSESSGLNDGNKRYFDAWMKINHPDAMREGMGIYILDETAGSGASGERKTACRCASMWLIPMSGLPSDVASPFAAENPTISELANPGP